MNQPNLPVMAPKTVPATDTQDVLSLLRRHIWLLISGAIVGTGVATAAFLYELKTNSRYTAHVLYEVLDRPNRIGDENGVNLTVGSDDTLNVLHRQELIFDQDSFLQDILKSDEFHPADPNDPEKRLDCKWLAENKKDPLKNLRHDLVIVPRINAAAFDLTMQARDPNESVQLVLAATKVYKSFLQNQSDSLKTANLSQIDDALKQTEGTFAAASSALEEFAKRKGIDVLRSRFDVEKTALQGLNEDFMKADAAAASAEAQLKAVTRKKSSAAPASADTQPATAAAPASAPASAPATAAASAPAPLEEVQPDPQMELTPEMQQYIENDPTLRSLLQTRLGWEQEMSVEITKSSPSKAHETEIQAREDEIDRQVAVTRAKLTSDTIKRMVEMYFNDAQNKDAVRDYIRTVRDTKEEVVKSLGGDLMDYQQRVDDLKERQTLLNKMRAQREIQYANRFTDDTRIHQLTSSPAVPDGGHPSWPKWYMFIPIGTIAGLGLSALLAYLLTLTDTRVRTPRDITRTLQLPLLGFVPDESDDRLLIGDVETAILSSPASMIAESFRQIRSHITAQTAHNPANTLLISSVTPGGGATTVAANFAAAMALNDLRVLLIDANLYRPSFSRIFKGMPVEGLADAISHPENASASIVPHPSLPTLHLMGAGSNLAPGSSEIFESKSFRELLEQLKSRYDLIIFDGAPLSLVADSLALGARVDGVVSVVRAGEVSRGAVTRIREQLRGVHANLLGFVLNAAQTSNAGYFKENYRNFYRYAGKNARRNLGE